MQSEPRGHDSPCWAAAIGECEGGITREHIVSRTTLDRTVTVRGLHWCLSDFKTVGRDSLTCHCLCAKHNNLLSPTDLEAKKLQEAAEWIASPSDSKSDGFGNIRSIDGDLFARWLAKTACNMAAAANQPVPSPFRDYAFGCCASSEVCVLMALNAGSSIPWDTSHLGAYWLVHPSDANQALVGFRFFGLPVAISTLRVNGTESPLRDLFEMPRDGPPFLARPRRIDVYRTVHRLSWKSERRGAIVFKWEPE